MGEIADMYFDRHEDDSHNPKWPTCKACGKEGLEWAHRSGRWQLLNEVGEPHHCDTTNRDKQLLKDFDE